VTVFEVDEEHLEERDDIVDALLEAPVLPRSARRGSEK
jgi:hypothetical protein